MIKQKIVDEMYHQDAVLVMNCSEKEFWDYIQKKYSIQDQDVSNADGKFVTIPPEVTGGSYDYYIWFEGFQNTVGHQALVAHELLHWCLYVLNNIGIKLCESSEEAYTYYYQHLFSQTLLAIGEVNKKTNAKKARKKTKGKK